MSRAASTLAQLAERNRLRAELQSLSQDRDRRFKAAREEGFDLLLSGANKERIAAKRQQPAGRGVAARGRPARRAVPAVPKRGWQQSTINVLTADGQQLRLRPHAEEAEMFGVAEAGPAYNSFGASADYAESLATSRRQAAEYERILAESRSPGRGVERAAAAAVGDEEEVEDTGEYGDDFEEDLEVLKCEGC